MWRAAANTLLVTAVKQGNVAVAARLLDGGADPNARETLVSKPSFEERSEGGKRYPGDTALMVAVEKGNAQLVRLLLDKGANVNGVGEAGFTALIDAARSGRSDLTALLLDRGAKPNQRNVHGDTAIDFAANVGQTKIVSVLLQHGADINSGTGWTPLMQAAYDGWEDTARFLIRRGADVNLRRGGGMTALEYAEVQHNDEIAVMLRKAGGKGRSPAVVRRASEQAARRWAEQEARSRPAARDQELTQDDRQVIEAALLDILAGKRPDVPIGNAAGKDIILVDRTARGSGLPMDSQMNSELDEKKANEVTLEMREHLAQRNSRPVSLAAFKPASAHILLRSEGQALSSLDLHWEKAPRARAWIHLYLPGYSKQHDRAVLRFWFGPTPHSAAGTYFLVKQDGAWKVRWKNFAFFA